VEAYRGAVGEADLATAKDALLSYAKRYLYELALPAEQKPTRQWVVHDDGRNGIQFLEHQDRGPLAAVMIDVLRARKSAVDEYVPDRVSASLKQGGRSGLQELDQFSPGLADVLRQTAHAIDAELSTLRTETFGVRHDSLSDAIAWRKGAQQAKLSRLRNSGTAIEHDHPSIRLMPLLDTALADVERASYYQGQRQERQEVLSLLASAESIAMESNKQRGQLSSLTERLETAGKDFDACKQRRHEAVARLEAVEAAHAKRQSANPIARLVYRLSGERKDAMGAITLERLRVAGWDKKLEGSSAQWSKAKSECDGERKAVQESSERLTQCEKQLTTFREAGRLGFLPPDVREKTSRLNLQGWQDLNHAAREEISAADKWIAKGHERAEMFRSVAKHGLAYPHALLRARALSTRYASLPQSTDPVFRQIASVPLVAREQADHSDDVCAPREADDHPAAEPRQRMRM